MLQPNQISLFIMSSASLIIFLFTSLWWRKLRRDKAWVERPPGQWVRVGEVSSLTVYPLKSARGRPVHSAQCAQLGLVDIEHPGLQLRDREFIIYDGVKKTAVSGLVNPKVVLLRTSPENKTTVKFSFPGEEDFHLQVPVNTAQVVLLNRWWGETVLAVDCGDDAARWFSQCLLNKTTGLRLGCFSQPTVPLRTVHNGWTQFAKVYKNLRSKYLGAYSYMASYLIINAESVAEVNSRLKQPVGEERYRGNIVVRGAPAYAEDSWNWLRLGDSVVLRGFKPCTRCAVIAVDQDSGKVDSNLEPLRTLKTYRQVESEAERVLAGSEPRFGLYAGLHTPGTLRVGDPVYVGV